MKNKVKKIIFPIFLFILLIFSINLFFISNYKKDFNSYDQKTYISIKNDEKVIDNPKIINSFDWKLILESTKSYLNMYINLDDLDLLKNKWKENENLPLNNHKIFLLNKKVINNSTFLETNTYLDFIVDIQINNLNSINSPLPKIINFKENIFYAQMLENFFIETEINSNSYNFNNENAMALSFVDINRNNPEFIYFANVFEKIYGTPAIEKISNFDEPVPEDYYIYKFTDKFKKEFNFLRDLDGNIFSFEYKKTPGKIPIFAPINLFLNESIINEENNQNFNLIKNKLNDLEKNINKIFTAEKDLENDPKNSQKYLNSGNLILIIVLPIGFFIFLILVVLLAKNKFLKSSKKIKF